MPVFPGCHPHGIIEVSPINHPYGGIFMSEEKTLEQRVEELEKTVEKLLKEIKTIKDDLMDVEDKQENLSQRMNKNHLR